MKKFVREHFEDFVNKRNAAVIQQNMTSDFYDHNGPGNKPTDRNGDEQMMVAMYQAMPDLHLTIEDMIAESDKVMCRNIWRYTDPASKKRWNFMASCCGVSRVGRLQNVGRLSRCRLRRLLDHGGARSI